MHNIKYLNSPKEHELKCRSLRSLGTSKLQCLDPLHLSTRIPHGFSWQEKNIYCHLGSTDQVDMTQHLFSQRCSCEKETRSHDR